MGRGSGIGSERCLSFSVLMLNVTVGLLGLLLFCLAIWMRFERDVKLWISELGMYQYWTGLYILMAASIVVVLISFFGCAGTLNNDNTALLGANISLTSFTFVLLVFGAAVLLATNIEPTMDQQDLHNRFTHIFNGNNYRSDEFQIFLYYRVGCCGAINYQDYDRNSLPISDYCRDKISGNVFQDGCVRRFSRFIEKRSGWLAGIALFIGLLQIILVGLTFWHWKRIREVDDEDYPRNKGYYDPVPTKTR